MIRYLLDTNVVSHLIRSHPAVTRRVTSVPMTALCMSAVTAGELAYGLARRPEAVRLRRLVEELMRRVDVLAWDLAAAHIYGELRAALHRGGRALATLDLLIAAQALSSGAVLVTNDAAFRQVSGLTIQDWTVPAAG